MEITNQYSIKYRPKTWEDVRGQDKTVKALRKRILENNYGKAIILEGPYGCGKTTLAQIYAAAIMAHDKDGNPDWSNPECKAILDETFTGSVIRLDGGLFSGKNDMVEILADLNKRPLYTKERVIIIEECDQLSGASINALLKTLEDPHPWNHFILLSMLDKKGIPAAIKSRCQTYKINSLDIMPIMMGLKDILEKEGLWGSDKIPQSFFLEGLKTIAEASLGSMRSAVQYLEKCLMSEAWTSNEISDLLQVLDDAALWQVLDGLLAKTKDETILRKLIWLKTGDEVDHFLNYSYVMLSEAMIYKVTRVACDDGHEERLKSIASCPNLESLFYCLTLHPQLCKPFVRTSDLLGAISCYYQDVSFKPGTTQVTPTQTREVQRIQESEPQPIMRRTV
jgi:DNA polymerase-3 subunit gamma/tau